MNFKELNEEIKQYIEGFPLYEFAVYYGTDHGIVNNVLDGINKLKSTKEGMIHVRQNLLVEKVVTQDEIDTGLFQQIQKGIPVIREYPIVLVWGEPNKRKGNRSLEGHGLVHILQGHGGDFSKICMQLGKVINAGRPAKPDRSGNYTIAIGQYRFSFMVENNLDCSPKWAVLITAFKRV